MITDKLITIVEDFVYGEEKKYGAPSKYQTYFTNDKGQLLTERLGADKRIVFLGTLLMDCMLGKAFKEGKLKDHVEMSVNMAKELLSKDEDISDQEKEKIINCVREHHGTDKFSSLESEICSNADCYKFASVEGVIIAIKYTRDMPIKDLITLLLNKADEKWNALSLEICKKELKSEYLAIKDFLNNYQV